MSTRATTRATTPEDGLAYVTLERAQWAALVNSLPASLEPPARSCREAIVLACQASTSSGGAITLWQPAEGFTRLLSAVLRAGVPDACAVAASVTSQVYRSAGSGARRKDGER